jgi:hypothetical protein
MPEPRSNREPAGPASGQAPKEPEPYDDLDEQEVESFPASDPHSDWAGPGS